MPLILVLLLLYYRMVADLKKGTYYQKCHDPDCRRINFHSNGNKRKTHRDLDTD